MISDVCRRPVPDVGDTLIDGRVTFAEHRSDNRLSERIANDACTHVPSMGVCDRWSPSPAPFRVGVEGHFGHCGEECTKPVHSSLYQVEESLFGRHSCLLSWV